jgi:hypothetical protein
MKNAIAPTPSTSDWTNLFEQATTFKKIESWKTLYDSDLIAIKDSETGITCYCAIMGAAGEVFGVCAYLEENGLAG